MRRTGGFEAEIKLVAVTRIERVTRGLAGPFIGRGERNGSEYDRFTIGGGRSCIGFDDTAAERHFSRV
jgi:hypothetical protein